MRPDGSGHFVMDVRTSLMTHNGRPSGVLVVARDVTDQRRREKEIRESEERHRSILQTSMDGFYVTDMEGRFLTVNEAYSRICGFTEHELRAMRIADLSVKPAEEVTSYIRELIARGQDRFETLMRHKNGSTLPVEVTISYRAEDGGRLVGFLRDMTDHRKQEKKLRQQKEEFSHLHRLATVGEFAASIAHEIHQPLAAIMNNAQAADRFLSSDNAAAVVADVRECLKDIVADDRRAADVIRNLRLFLQRKRGDQTIVDVNDVIRGVLEILYGELVDKSVHVVQALSSDLTPVKCDRVALQQVLMNLIMNACDALSDADRQRREILIRTAMKRPGAVVVSVQDKGTGIDPENMHRIFESYYTTKPEGLGMGLSISKSIITSHGGRIWAKNNDDGGATFCFTLPAQEG